jgi:HJR/Mrr/RecB family endonuclease
LNYKIIWLVVASLTTIFLAIATKSNVFLIAFAVFLAILIRILMKEGDIKEDAEMLKVEESFKKSFSSFATDQTIKSLIFNFYDEFPERILLKSSSFDCMEKVVYGKCHGYRDIFSLPVGTKLNERTYVPYGNDVMNPFQMLIKILNKYYGDKSETYSMYVTWELLKFFAVEYYANQWKQDYGQYFEDIDDITIFECVKRYCSIDVLDYEDEKNIAIFTYFLMSVNKFQKNIGNNFSQCNEYLNPIIEKEIENQKLLSFEKKLSSVKEEVAYTIDDTDLMTGVEFENFIAIMFSKMGYSTQVTKASGDQGIDIIAQKSGKKLGIQAKCYSNTVPNAAIQEVAAGIVYYKLDKGLVVTNNYFSKSAMQLAESNNVILWDRNMLREKIFEIFSSIGRSNE